MAMPARYREEMTLRSSVATRTASIVSARSCSATRRLAQQPHRLRSAQTAGICRGGCVRHLGPHLRPGHRILAHEPIEQRQRRADLDDPALAGRAGPGRHSTSCSRRGEDGGRVLCLRGPHRRRRSRTAWPRPAAPRGRRVRRRPRWRSRSVRAGRIEFDRFRIDHPSAPTRRPSAAAALIRVSCEREAGGAPWRARAVPGAHRTASRCPRRVARSRKLSPVSATATARSPTRTSS